MRRKEHQIEDRGEIDSILSKALVGRIGMSLRDRPYVVPVNFLYSQGKIYFHSANEGQMYTWLNANNKVCFEVEELGETIPNVNPCEFSFKYKSVIAFGIIRFLQDPKEKTMVLTKLVEKYDTDNVTEKDIPPEKVDNVEVGEITIDHITGKSNTPA